MRQIKHVQGFAVVASGQHAYPYFPAALCCPCHLPFFVLPHSPACSQGSSGLPCVFPSVFNGAYLPLPHPTSMWMKTARIYPIRITGGLVAGTSSPLWADRQPERGLKQSISSGAAEDHPNILLGSVIKSIFFRVWKCSYPLASV